MKKSLIIILTASLLIFNQTAVSSVPKEETISKDNLAILSDEDVGHFKQNKYNQIQKKIKSLNIQKKISESKAAIAFLAQSAFVFYIGFLFTKKLKKNEETQLQYTENIRILEEKIDEKIKVQNEKDSSIIQKKLATTFQNVASQLKNLDMKIEEHDIRLHTKDAEAFNYYKLAAKRGNSSLSFRDVINLYDLYIELGSTEKIVNFIQEIKINDNLSSNIKILIADQYFSGQFIEKDLSKAKYLYEDALIHYSNYNIRKVYENEIKHIKNQLQKIENLTQNEASDSTPSAAVAAPIVNRQESRGVLSWFNRQ